LALLLVPSALAAHDLCWEFEEVNVPTDYGDEATGTSWWGVNNHDVFVGNYCVDEDCYVIGAAMYDARAGTFETFTPGEDYAEWRGINDRGQIGGNAWSYLEAIGYVGYTAVWEPDGEVTYLDNPDLGYPDGDYFGGNLNARGEVVGTFWDSDQGRYRGVIWTSAEEWTIYDGGEDDEHTYLLGISDDGDLTGLVIASDWSTNWDFVDKGAGPEFYEPPDSTAQTGWSLNNRGIVVGWQRLEGVQVPMIKDGDDYATFPIPGTENSSFCDIAENGTVAATGDGYSRGFLGWRVPCH
ncbi:MAG: hypothetical protein JXB39_09840, partial [Deltaproteobacteria bacterium]|nr:hypothetical protein [Deltaproteobacteria bacterium]